MATVRDALKQQEMEAEMSRFEAEILSPTYAPVISANTYSQVQQQLQTHAQFVLSSFFLPPQLQRSSGLLQAATANTGYPYLTNGSLYVDNSYEVEKAPKKEEPVCSIPTPVVISAAPKAYSGRQQILPPQTYQVYQPQPDPKAAELAKKEELLTKAREMAERVRASTIVTTSRDEALMRRRRIDTKPRKYIRVAGGQVWEDNSLSDWDPGKYVGSRPIKLRKSSWRERNVEVVHKKALEKSALGLLT